MFKAFITCSTCKYGRDLMYGDYGCRCEERIAEVKSQPPELNKEQRLKMVNKANYSCKWGVEKND